MQFAFTEEQLAITQAARDMLLDACTPVHLRRLLGQANAIDVERWQTIKEMGLLAIMAPEDLGGLGLSTVDLLGTAEAAGYVALPEPLVEQAGIAIPLLARLTDQPQRLARALEGGIVALGHPLNPLVENADIADCLLFVEEDALQLLDRQDVTIVRHASFDPFRRLFEVRWSAENAITVRGNFGDIASRGAVLAAAQLIGLAQRCIDLAVTYAKERSQFNKPIGSYQAVKHLLATAQVKVEFARPVVQAAAAELSNSGLVARARASHAKIAAGAAADLAARTAVQVHGAMGITWEVDVHFFLKRALSLNYAWGTPAKHRREVFDRIQFAATGPEATFASEAL